MKKKIFTIMLACSLLTGCGASKESNLGSYDNNSTEAITEASYIADNTETTASDEDGETETTTESENETAYEITYTNAQVQESYSGVMVDVIVEIENTGTSDLYLSNGACDLEDENGHLVSAMKSVPTYPNVISPGEKGYMYDTITLDNYSGDLELTVLPRPHVEKASIHKTRYEISDVSTNNNDWDRIDVIGRLTCTSDQVESVSYVAAIFYDADHTPIGISDTVIMEDLNPNDTIGFELSGITLPEGVNTDTVADYEIFAYPAQFQ